MWKTNNYLPTSFKWKRKRKRSCRAAYVSAVGGAPTDDTQWYKDWRYWAVIALIAAVLIYLYMRSKKGSGEEQPLVVEMSRYSNA